MNGRILTAVLFAFIVFAVYSWYTASSEGFDINKQMYADAEVYTAPPEAPTDPSVSSAGPSPPSQRPPRTQPTVIMQEEKPFDPQEQSHETADMPDRLRHPERMFSPGLNNDEVNTAVLAGTASKVTGEANQTFGPEFAQNGGLFMENITAHDASLETGYSSL